MTVTRSGISYYPGSDHAFDDVPRTEIKEVKRSGKKDKPGMTVRLKKRQYNFRPKFLAAVRALPEAPDLEVDWRVRSRLIELVAKLESPPSPPEEARWRMAYAVTALEGATTAAEYDKALAEWYGALKTAPWWAPLYFDTAMVLEQGGYLASARSHLELYLLAAPNAEDRETVQQKIYSLEYKANNQ